MAAIAQYFQIPNNITSGTWNWGDVAYGFRSGLLLTQPPVNVLLYNNLPYPPDLQPLVLISFTLFPMNTLFKVARLCRSEKWVAHYKPALALGTYALLGANAYTGRTGVYNQKISHARTYKNKFLITIWKATPYLVLLTNIALTIIELRVNRMKALVGLTVMAATMLNLTHIMPRSYARYLNPVIRFPMDLVALYYGSNKNRFTIVLGWAQDPAVRNPIKERLKPLLPKQWRDLL